MKKIEGLPFLLPHLEKAGTSAMMREMDRRTIEEFGIPGVVLMENAGRKASEFILSRLRPCRAAVFAGKGNNGGDGYVIARHLMNAGVEVETLLLAKPEEIKGDARTNLEALRKTKGRVRQALDIAALEDSRYRLAECDLVVDAILGTGIDKPVRGFYEEVINFINKFAQENPRTRVFAVDIPSGINADNGQIMGCAVKAHYTVTFGMMKTGLLSFPGAEYAGKLAVADISIPAFLYEEIPHCMITSRVAASLLPRRKEDCHKGNVGHGLVIAGSPGKTGAAVMAAESALRAGAGLVTLAGPESLHPVFETKTLEVMTEPLPQTAAATLGPPSLDRALELAQGKTAAALGPGIGGGKEVAEFVKAFLRECGAPLVIDADGLNAIAQDPAMLKHAKAPVVLTPHPGEMARLAGVDTKTVLADRMSLALKFAKEFNAVVALKGAHTLIATPGGGCFFNLTGNPGMASGGSGDVLTGVILGLLCQGLSPEGAAVLGVYLHGLAGDLAREERGEAALIARDIMDKIGAAWLALAGEAAAGRETSSSSDS